VGDNEFCVILSLKINSKHFFFTIEIYLQDHVHTWGSGTGHSSFYYLLRYVIMKELLELHKTHGCKLFTQLSRVASNSVYS
jgi:hypothetical protein